MQTQFNELINFHWEIIKDFLPVQRKRKCDLWEILNAISFLVLLYKGDVTLID